jgi:hypothetical protein
MKHKFTFEAPQIKHRAHRVLFEENSPFKPKSVQAKNKYKRRPKNNRDVTFWL